MKKDIAGYLIISLRLIMFNIHLLFTLLWFIPMTVGIPNLFALLLAIFGFIHLPICNKLLSICKKSNKMTVKILSVLGAMLLAIVVLLYDIIFGSAIIHV